MISPESLFLKFPLISVCGLSGRGKPKENKMEPANKRDERRKRPLCSRNFRFHTTMRARTFHKILEEHIVL